MDDSIDGQFYCMVANRGDGGFVVWRRFVLVLIVGCLCLFWWTGTGTATKIVWWGGVV